MTHGASSGSGNAVNEHLYRLYRQNLRRNTTVKEYRQMHKLERVFFALPAKAYVRWHHLRHKFKNRRTSSEVLFNTPEEDA